MRDLRSAATSDANAAAAELKRSAAKSATSPSCSSTSARRNMTSRPPADVVVHRSSIVVDEVDRHHGLVNVRGTRR